MPYYLAFQNNYDEVQIALLQDTRIIDQKSVIKTKASKELIVLLNDLLVQNSVRLADIVCFIANEGPGPFTTLRVVITTVNGLSFATAIPIIGVNALEVALSEWRSAKYPATAIFFNAFGADVYSIIEHHNKIIFKGVAPVNQLIALIKASKVQTRFLGNGAKLYQQLIEKELGSQAIIPDVIPDYCSIDAIAQEGISEWEQKKKGTFQLMPYYLKKHPAQL